MWRYDDARAAMRDALRLSRAMTYKNAVAGCRSAAARA
jgi:leucine dehydrogenase